MNPMNFEQIWRRFSWVLDEMKDGMCFFEGYIPAIGQSELLSPLSELVSRSCYYSLMSSHWANSATKADWEKEYTLAEYVEYFHSNKIVLLHFDYELVAEGIVLSQKLMLDKYNTVTALEIVCYREPILCSDRPKNAVRTAISEFRFLNQLFRGNALFIGPDTLDYPKSGTDYPDEWLRIE